MPLPTIPFAMRCAIKGHLGTGPEEVVNVIHVTETTPGDEASVHAALAPAWSDLVSPLITAILHIDNITYTRLDGSASVQFPFESAQPTASGTTAAANVSMCSSWRTALGGRAHRGRSYLGPPTNSFVDNTAPDLWFTSQVTNQTTRGTAFIGVMLDAGFPLGVASYVNSSIEHVTRCVVNPRICTQRKRTNGR
jgi:hypothetical protein